MDNLETFVKYAKGSAKLDIFKAGQYCVKYTRVSSKEQAETNMSLPTQDKNCTELIAKKKWECLATFGGTYESAKTDERKEFQKMIEYVKKSKKKISFIVVFALDRFSRTGANAIWLSRQLQELGIHIVSVTQPIDTSNPAGVLQQNILFLFSQYDNDVRRIRCVGGMKEMLLRGEWPNKAPIGYDHIWTNNVRKIVVNETGKLIRKAFMWRLNETCSYEEIALRLSSKGLNLGQNAVVRVGQILRNPFYCGLLSHNLLEGKIVVGNHEKLVSQEIFSRINNISPAKPSGFKQLEENNSVPLKRFMKCEECGRGMRGYIAKQWNLGYYKCNTAGCKNNRNSEIVHDSFKELLLGYKVDEKYKEVLEYQMKETFNQLNAGKEENQKSLKKKLEDVNTQLDRLDERYILEEIKRDLYEKYKAKFEKEKAELQEQLGETGIEVSKLKNCVKFVVSEACNLLSLWENSDYNERQKLQNRIFPEGIIYNRKNDSCRSEKTNSVFTYIAELASLLKECKIETVKNLQQSNIWSC